MKILGIETSCDETAAAIIEDGNHLLSSVVASSVDLHRAYGGVVPEVAARSHLEVITPVIDQAMSEAGANWGDIDAIAVTQGPGLGGSLLIGVLTARTLAIAQAKPLYAIDHVLAHIYAAFIDNSPQFPLLALVVSGGHTQLVLMQSHTDYRLLGQTGDDAIGEAFDKVAKILGLPYPGGPSVSTAAGSGDPHAVELPISKLSNPYDFSFSGLKTAVLRAAQAMTGHDFTLPSVRLPGLLTTQQKADLAASFQATAIKTVVDKLSLAYHEFEPKTVVICGGVAANTALREACQAALPIPPLLPEFKLCTDNAAMIAACAAHHKVLVDPYQLDISPALSM